MEDVTLKGGKKIPKASRKVKKAAWWKYLLTFLGGLTFGVGSVVGGVAIAGTVMKSSDVIKMIGMNPNEILGSDYRNLSILQMVQKLATTKIETLGDIDNITPIIGKTFNERINQLLIDNLHYEMNWEELKIKPFQTSTSGRPASEVDPNETLGEYIPRALKNGITLASFLDPEGEASGIERIFLYPKDSGGEYLINSPYCINDYLQDGFIDSLKNNIKIGDVVENVNDNPFLAQMADWGINEFSDSKIQNELLLGPLFSGMSEEEKDQNPIVNALESWTISDLTDFDNILSLRLEEVIDLRTATGFMGSIKTKTLNEIKNPSFINTIPLSEVFPDATGLLKVVADKGCTVGDLNDSDTVLDLQIQEIFADLSSDNLLYKFREKTLNEISEMDVSELKLTDIYDVSDIEANHILNAIYNANHDVSIGDLSNFSTFESIAIGDLYPDSSNNVVSALITSGATIGNLETKINGLTLNDLVECDNPDSTLGRLLNAIGSSTLSTLGSSIDGLKVSQLVDIDETDPNTPQILIVLKEQEVEVDEVASFMSNLTAKDIIKIGGPEDPLYGIKDVSVTNSNDLITGLKNNLTLKDVVDIDLESPNTPQVLKSLAGTTLSSIGDVLKTLTLDQVIHIDESSPQILQSLKNTVVFGQTDNLETRLVNLKFKDYFTSSDCSSGILKVLWDNSDGGDFLISQISTKINDLKLVDILEDKIYETDGVTIKKSWWYLLTEEGETFTSEQKYKVLKNGALYKLSDLDKLITNMEYHVNNETIRDLYEAQLINITDPSKLDRVIVYHGESVMVGDLTISQVLNYYIV